MTTTNNTTASKISQQFKAQIKGKVTCKSSGDLMSNFIAGTAINAENEIEVIQDSNGDPILFSISTPINTTDGTNVNQLFMTYRDKSVGTGWKQVNISPVTNSSMHIFGVSQDPVTSEFVLAVAVQSSDNPAQNTDTVYITDSISSDTSKWDWTDAASNWTVRNGTPDGATVERILVGQNSNVSKIPLIIGNVQIGTSAQHYFIQGDTTKTNFSEYNSSSTNTWLEYQMPEGATEILDLSIGTMYLHKKYRLGTYALYNVGTELRLTFTSVPDLLLKLSYDLQLTPPAGTVAIQALPDQNENDVSMLFAAGNGLYIFESANQLSAVTNNVPATATLISDVSAFSNISQMIARQDSSHISIWVRDNQVLWYVRGTQNASARDWTVPLSLSQNVARIAAIRNQPKAANAIMIAGSNGKTLSYMWQDNQTTLWKQTDMPLPTLDSVQEFSCYTTVLSFTDENDNPIVQQNVGINASEWTYATVNGYYKSLDNDTANPVMVKTDSQGKVTIINKVINASTPAFWATSDFLETQYTAHPAANVLNGFKGITSAQDLLNATTQTGNPVIPEDLRGDTNTLDSIANGISQIMRTVNKLPSNGSPYTTPPSGGATALVAENQIGQIWGMSFNQGSATFQIGDNARQLFQQLSNNRSSESFATPESSIETDIEQVFVWAGDALQSMWSDIEGVTKFVVDTTENVIDGVANIIVQIGKQVVSFVIKTISDVLSFISWLLKTIKVGIETLIEWLGFIFDWDDILATHNFFKFMSNQTLNYFGAVIKNAETPITQLFDNLIDRVNKMPAFQIPGELDMNLLTAIPSQTQNLSSAGQKDLQNIITNPGFNFTTYQTEHGGVSGEAQYVGGGNVSTTVDLTDKTVQAQFEQVLKDILNTLKDGLKSFEQVFKDIGTLIKNNELTLGNLAKVISKDVIVGILTFAKDLFISFIDLADLMIELIISTINSKINIPFISGLYSHITDGNDFTLLDSFALLGAIPTTIGYKLLTGEAPFKQETGIETLSYEQIFPMPFFPKLPQQETQSFMATVTASTAENTESSDNNILNSRVYTLAGGLLGTISGAISVISNYVEYGVDEEAKEKRANLVSGLFYTDLLFSILTVASTFPVADGDSERDKIENYLDYPIWFLELLDVVIKGVVPGLKVAYLIDKGAKIKKGEEIEEDVEEAFNKFVTYLEEKVIPPVESLYQTGEGAIDLIINFISLFVETYNNDDFDGWDGAKQIQNLCASMGIMLTGTTGALMMSSEETDDPYEAIATGAVFVLSLFLNSGATLISLVRAVNTAVFDVEEILEYR